MGAGPRKRTAHHADPSDIARHARFIVEPTSFAGDPDSRVPSVTNVRNVVSPHCVVTPHWRRWLGVESRCVVPFTSFAENELQPNGSRPPLGDGVAQILDWAAVRLRSDKIGLFCCETRLPNWLGRHDTA